MFEKKYYYIKDDSRPFIFLDNIDLNIVAPAAEYILSTVSEKNLRWDKNRNFEGSHWWTFPFCFRFSEYQHKMSESTSDKITPLKKLYTLLCPIFEKIEQVRPDLEIFYTEINYILPGESIRPHKDNFGGLDASFWFLGCTCRIHVPLFTNDNAIMTSGNETKHLPMGTIYEFHNNLIHYVENKGSSPRAHLVMDLVPKKYKPDLEYFLKKDPAVRHIADL